MYGHHYTPQTIFNMTKAMSEQVEAFKARPLDARYACVYLDAIYIPLKRDTVSKEAIYIAVGTREDGWKEVLAYTVAPTESAFVWEEVLQDLKERGVEEVLLFISDGLKGITDRASSRSFQMPSIRRAACIYRAAFSTKSASPIARKFAMTSNRSTVPRAGNWVKRRWKPLSTNGKLPIPK